MATITSNATGGGVWSAGASWAGGSAPADGDTFVIAAGDTIVLDVDLSAWTGLAGACVITGGVTPGMLVCKSDADGTYCLRFRTGATLAGTLDTNKGRMLANSDGVWGHTGALPFGRKLIILLDGTAQITADNLDIRLHCTDATIASARTYGVIKTVESVDPDTDTITITGHGWSAGQTVHVRSSGTLPGGLQADYIYYVRAVTASTFKLAAWNGDYAIINITSAGSGTIEIYTGHTSTSTGAMNVLDDVTADTAWTTTAGHNRVVLTSSGPANYDQQRSTLNTIASGVLTLAANVDSAQYPGARIWLVARNVSIRSSSTSSSQPIVNGGADCVLGEIVNTAGTGTTFYGYGINSGSGHTVTTISGCRYGINTGSGHTVTTISGCSSGIYYGSGHTVTTISGCSNGIYYGSGHTVTTISGCSNAIYYSAGNTVTTISGCNYGIYYSSGNTATTISGCNYGIYYSAGNTATTISGCNYGVNAGGIIGRGATLSANTTDIAYPANNVLFGSSISSATQVSNYLGQSYSSYVISYDHGGSAGRVRGWTSGGTIASQEWASVPGAIQTGCPITPDFLHLATFELASYWNWFEWPLHSDGSTPIQVVIYCRKQQTGETDLPRFAICQADHLLGDAAGELDAEDMADNTDWQTITLDYTPTTTEQVVLRFTAKNASGTCYLLPVVTPYPTAAEIAAAMWSDETSPDRSLTA